MYGSVGSVKVGYSFLFTLTMKKCCVLNLWSILPELHVTICKFDIRIFIHWKFLGHVSSLRQQGDLTVKLQTTVCGSGRILGYVPLIFIFIPSLCFGKHHYKSGIHSVPQSSRLFTYMKHQSLLSPLPSLWACKIYQAWKLDEKTRKFLPLTRKLLSL